jgi:hypothetical protein
MTDLLVSVGGEKLQVSEGKAPPRVSAAVELDVGAGVSDPNVDREPLTSFVAFTHDEPWRNWVTKVQAGALNR